MTARASRRRLLAAGLALPVARLAYAQPTCGALSASQTEGPFFKPNSPQRNSLVEARGKGTRLVVSGRALSPRCTPVAGALLDFWHADEAGEYDNSGFHYRGHQFADAEGRWRLETIVPAVYPGRARHIHVKVQAPGKRVLTTQLYFPADASNARDSLYRNDLAMHAAARGEASFDFVVEA